MQGGTYGGSILGCAAANATIDAIEEDGMLENAEQRGVQLIKVLSPSCDPFGKHDFFNTILALCSLGISLL